MPPLCVLFALFCLSTSSGCQGHSSQHAIVWGCRLVQGQPVDKPYARRYYSHTMSGERLQQRIGHTCGLIARQAEQHTQLITRINRGTDLSYEKHIIYTGTYQVNTQGVFNPPPESEWAVLAQIGEHEEGGEFTVVDGKAESICLILQDEDFWPVMSFITHTEARLLAHTLLEAVGDG